MFARLGKLLIRLSSWTSTTCQPRQIALAVTLGVCCGLFSASSLLFWLGLFGLCMLPIHLAIALASCLAVQCTRPLLEPFLGILGQWSLDHQAMFDGVSRLNTIPWIPWLQLHNTVIHGGILAAVAQAFPTYLVVLSMLRRCEQHGNGRASSSETPGGLVEHGLEKSNAGESVARGSMDRKSQPPARFRSSAEKAAVDLALSEDSENGIVRESQSSRESPRDSVSPDLGSTQTCMAAAEKVKAFLEDCRETSSPSAQASEVARRAAALTMLVDDMLLETDHDASHAKLSEQVSDPDWTEQKTRQRTSRRATRRTRLDDPRGPIAHALPKTSGWSATGNDRLLPQRSVTLVAPEEELHFILQHLRESQRKVELDAID